MYKLFLAGRYTLGRPVSYLAMVAIGLAVMALIAVAGIMNGFLAETERVIRGTTADVIVTPFPWDGEVPSRAKVAEVIEAHPSVKAAAPRFSRPAVFKMRGRDSAMGLSKFAEHFMVSVVGIDVENESRATEFDAYLAAVRNNPEGEGYAVESMERPFRLDRGRIRDPELRFAPLPRVLMAHSRMLSFGLKVGDALEIVTIPDSSDLDSKSFDASTSTFVIAGAYDTSYDKFDGATLFVPREDFPAWAGTDQEFNEVAVQAVEGADLEALKHDLEESLERELRMAFEVETWEDRHATWLGAVKNERNILFVLFGFFLLLVCTITFSVLTMLVQQKVRDIGILSSMGATAGGIGAVFALSGVMIATLGGLFGLLAGELLAAKLNTVKDWIEATFGVQIFDRRVYAFSEIPMDNDHLLNLGITGVTVIAAVFICLIPALRAAWLDPVDALRHE
ncbi:MAG: LolC/E family lipoprotein releasing system, protein [Planctomycetota bacterium]|nr:MAG: LolC/E family lipoprotein releasing system, protein [Planctomycetota bacterium]